MHPSPLPVPDWPLPPELAPELVALAAGLTPMLPPAVLVTFHLVPPPCGGPRWGRGGVGTAPLVARRGALSFVPAPGLGGERSPLLLVDRPNGLELQRIDSE